MNKRLHPLLPKERWPLASIATKVCNSVRNCIKPESEKILRGKKNGFRRKQSRTSQILTIRRIIEGVSCKKSCGNSIVYRFLLDIWFYSQRKYRLYRNTKFKVRSLDGDTDIFDIFAGRLPEDTFAPYLFVIRLRLRTSNIHRFNKRKWLYTKKYKKQKLTDAGNAEDIALRAGTTAQSES